MSPMSFRMISLALLSLVSFALTAPTSCAPGQLCDNGITVFKLVTIRDDMPELHNKALTAFNSTLGIFPRQTNTEAIPGAYGIYIPPRTAEFQPDSTYGPARLSAWPFGIVGHQLALVGRNDSPGLYTMKDTLSLEERNPPGDEVRMTDGWVVGEDGLLGYAMPPSTGSTERAGWFAFPVDVRPGAPKKGDWAIKWYEPDLAVVIQIGQRVEIQVVADEDQRWG
ncbi:hypothetical protein P152DRAFT_455650 [Eremomyces bilateralis CBS 781.70]|uniref:Uncharacterized protein n=1 Tax=Eremomyces bilateralis CBS 781.70 TaxID=1392243 RepID=A0A6G1GCV5_9PEZI|nr:uncharacterized protein P152DRAFT_455650 [Eremomyces bilateralis CBS 781.70]KAF1815925.1 hypothetical protein P152DRAFT_455650 [Eremomyces bilateralis CBS 781.70]